MVVLTERKTIIKTVIPKLREWLYMCSVNNSLTIGTNNLI